MRIGLATVTNKTRTVLAQNLENMLGDGVDKCVIVNHCSPQDALTHEEISKIESTSSSTEVKVINHFGKFHEARNESLSLLDTDAKVIWNDDHVFSSNEGTQIFRDRIVKTHEVYGDGHFVFTMPTFGIHPRLINKAHPFTGKSGDACICIGKDSGIEFYEDSKYADRQRHKSKIKAFIGSCGVLHLDQLKSFEFLAYRGQLNSKMRNFNLDGLDLKSAWQTRLGQPLEDTIHRLLNKMENQPSEYFYVAPESLVQQLPKELRDLASLSVKDFRKEFFHEDLNVSINIDTLETYDFSQAEKHWLYSDFT